MLTIVKRSTLIFATLSYMIFIWLQSSYFNPALLETYSSDININLLIFIGILLELAHLFEFGVLYLFLIITILSFTNLNLGLEVFAIFISIGYGFIDEVHQMIVPFRSASVGDLIKNSIGVMTAWWIVHKFYYSNKSKIGQFLRTITVNTESL